MLYYFFFREEDGIRAAQEFCFFEQETAYEISACLVGSEMFIRYRATGGVCVCVLVAGYRRGVCVCVYW